MALRVEDLADVHEAAAGKAAQLLQHADHLLRRLPRARHGVGAARGAQPLQGSVGMLSIPRDLWVTIPGYGENRINTAHYLGDKNGYPGGGPALAMKTVQYNLGVPVHFYVRVDFDGFRRIVDTLGGIDIEIPQTINDPKYPDENYGYDPFYIEAGLQHLDGDTALKYARTRATAGADFARARRQQQVLFAIREKAAVS